MAEGVKRMNFKDMFVYPRYPDNLNKLYLLAYNLWCTWNYDAIDLFYRIDGQLFRAMNHNPVKFLLNLPRATIDRLSNDKDFISELDSVWESFQAYMKYSRESKSGGASNAGWNQGDVIAYFSMEFGLHECIPIYGGGLGVLSGDFLKTASDLGLPVIGVGLIYKYGYFTQRINLEGRQEEMFVEFENHLLPIKEIRGSKGQKLRFEIKMLDKSCQIKLWQIDVGQTKLILLDTDIENNPPQLRNITDELYVADREKRIQQEIVLGFGGVKALEILGIKPKIYHINEGHSAFLIIPRMQKLMSEGNQTFTEAKTLVRASTVFTTHTPVIAGNEHFETKLAKRYLEQEIKTLGLTFDEFLGDGFLGDNRDVFWLPALAIKFAKNVNAVSKIHSDVSRKMWSGLFPATPLLEIPIDYVTNGVHWSWLSEPFTKLFSRHIGPGYIRAGGNSETWKRLADIPDEEIWEAHHNNKCNLIGFIRRKLADDLTARGYPQSRISNLTRLFNPEYLTVVFARRFAFYKRATLILKDKERLQKILNNARKPIQLIFAGKAHPADTSGKYMIKEIIDFAKNYRLEDKVVFLENYDMDIARHLLWGADVWLNTPMMENEASGTSGMKAAMNGVLNLSVPDGWWAEGFNGKNGWAITAGAFYKNSALQEIAEANQLYDLLEDEITELFYERNEAGIPKQWVKLMKESITSVCGCFNMNRVLMEYLAKYYKPGADDFDKLAGDNFKYLKNAVSQEQEIVKCWDAIRFADFSTSLDKMERITEGDKLDVQAAVNLDYAPAELFSVELFYMFDDKRSFRVIPMRLNSRQGNVAYYECSFNIEGFGLHNINIRLRPADPTVRDLHPEMVKWGR
jgi:starch phosphorylase